MPRTTTEHISPAQLAEKGVQDAFTAICQPTEVPDSRFALIIYEVEEALVAAHKRKHGRAVAKDDLHLLSRRAGYLVGVRVGLLLGGGVR